MSVDIEKIILGKPKNTVRNSWAQDAQEFVVARMSIYFSDLWHKKRTV